MRSAYPHFPDSCCTGACLLLLEKVPTLRLAEGTYDDGFIEHDGTLSGPCGHTWLVCNDGTIIDPTLGQFDEGEPFRIVTQDMPQYAFYEEAPPSKETERYHARVREEVKNLLKIGAG